MPLFDQSGKEVIAFTSRDTDAPKRYQHWQESFDKSRYLYGLHLAKDAIRRTDKAIIVEGQFDTMCLHTYGFDMTVGLCGHALTIMHVTLLARYCSEIYLLLDPDDAGNSALEHAKSLYKEYDLRECGLTFVPVRLPNKTDPDDYVRQQGSSALVNLLKDAKQKASND